MTSNGLTAGRVLVDRARDQRDALRVAELAIRSGNSDGVHDARVAARRIIAALATFRPVLDRAVSETLREELRWLARSLGAARDQDVARERLLGLLVTHAAALPDSDVLVRQLQAPDPDPDDPDPIPDPIVVLEGDHYPSVVAALEAFVADPQLTRRAGGPARPFLRARLRSEWDRLVGVVEVVVDAPVGGAGDTQLHDARKAAKRMRYALETAEDVWAQKPRALRRYVHLLTDVLGEQQDTVVTREVLRRLASEARGRGDSDDVHGALLELEEARAGELEAVFRRDWAEATQVRRAWP